MQHTPEVEPPPGKLTKVKDVLPQPRRAQIQEELGIGKPDIYQYRRGDNPWVAGTSPHALVGEKPYEVALQEWSKDPELGEIIEGLRSVLAGDTTPVEMLSAPLSKRQLGRMVGLAIDAPILGSKLAGGVGGYKIGSPSGPHPGKLIEYQETMPHKSVGFRMGPYTGTMHRGAPSETGISGRLIDELGAYIPKTLRTISVTSQPEVFAGGRAPVIMHEMAHAIYGIRDKGAMYTAYKNILGMTEEQVQAILREEVLPLSLGTAQARNAWLISRGKVSPAEGKRVLQYVSQPQELLADGVAAIYLNREKVIREAPRFAKSLADLAKADPEVGKIYTVRSLLPLAAAGTAVGAAMGGPAGMVNQLGE